jgi:hypothetical protein
MNQGKPAKEAVDETTGLFETESAKEFASAMEQRGVLEWWRKAMGFTVDDRL